MKNVILTALLALTPVLAPAANAQATAPAAAPSTAPMAAAPVTQQGLIFSSLTPAAGTATTVTLPLSSGQTAPALRVGGVATQTVKAGSSAGGTATYTVTFPKAGIYTLEVEGQPQQRIRVGGERLSSPLVHLNFDDAAAPLRDLSGLGHDGKAVGELRYVDSVKGKGLSFANAASYVELPHSAALDTPTQDLTMSIWLKPNNEVNYSDFFTKGDWNVLKTDSRNNSISFFTGGWRRGETEAAQPADWNGQWHHLVGVVKGEEARLYLDGELVNETEVEGKLGWTPFAWNLGRNAEAPEDRGFKGVLDDVRIYPFALNDAEVQTLFKQGQ